VTATAFKTIDLSKGDDTFNWNGTVQLTKVDGGVGTDNLVFTNATTLDFTTTAGAVFVNFEKLTGSSDADNIVGKTTFKNIDLQAGNDTFTWKGDRFASVDGGAGNDTLIFGIAQVFDVTNTTNAATAFANFEALEGSIGADTVKVNTNFKTIDLKAGNYIFNWDGNTSYTKIDGGEGLDKFVITPATGATLDFTSGVGTNYTGFEILTGSNGNDNIVANSSLTSADLGAGDDTFTWDGSSAVKVNGGVGTDALKLSKAGTFTYGAQFANFEKWVGSTGADTVNVTNKIGSYDFSDGGKDKFVFTKANWGTGSTANITLNYTNNNGTELDISDITIIDVGTSYTGFTYNLVGGGTTVYTASVTEGSELTIDFSTAKLGSIKLVGGDTTWATSNTSIHDSSGHTMYWDGGHFLK
jgi:hypothetical protein